MFGIFVRALCFALALFPALAFAQHAPAPGFPPGVYQNRAALDAPPAASFQGIGDLSLSGGQPFIGGSCARVYKASQANTSTSLCDLVAVTGGAAVCTLRGSSTGFVDLSAYCPGSLTPSAACAAASGGSCKVTKVYDLVGGTPNPWIQASLASMPPIVFNTLNGLPAVQCVSAAPTSMVTGSTATVAKPFSLSTVYERTANFTTAGAVIGSTSNNMIYGTGASANQAFLDDASANSVTATMSDGTGPSDFTHFHALLGLYGSGTNASVLTVDGTDTTGTTNNAITGTTLRLCRGNATATPDGYFMEAYIWPSSGALTSGDRTAVNSNIHSATSGYNF